MYDLHCHMLPAIDDGAIDLKMALGMAKAAVEDGITNLACTPHIYPGLFLNTPQGISQALQSFQSQLQQAGIPLELSYGADIQVGPELLTGLCSGALPTINGTRYFLFEPSHHVPLPNFDQLIFNVVAAGYVPVVTHPERLSWIEDHYEQFIEAVKAGAWMQLTAGSLTGRFGRVPKYWAERMLEDGVVHLLATDAHNLGSRPPLLAEAEQAAIPLVGAEEARRLVLDRPRAVWENAEPARISLPPGFDERGELQLIKKRGMLGRLFFGN